MKHANFKVLALIFLALISLSLSFAFILMHSCGSGYYLNPHTVATATPTPIPTGEDVNYVPYSVSWTNGADFSGGVFDGIDITPGGNQLQLGVGGQQSFQPTQICIAASSIDQVWMHDLADPGNDSKTKKVTLPKFTGDSIVSPSRTAIDKDGNCWVGGRGNGGVYKISKEGAILGKVKIPGSSPNARAVAIDKNGFVWVGDFTNRNIYKISPGEDVNGNLTVIEGPYNAVKPTGGLTSGGPYGAAVDSKGFLWVTGYKNGSSITPGFISKIDTTTGEVVASAETNTYGLVIDMDDNPWVGGLTSGTLNKINKDTTAPGWTTDPHLLKITLSVPTGESGIDSRGVGVDTDGNIWVADSQNNYVYKFKTDGTYLGKVTTKGTYPIGVSGDPSKDVNGNPYGWVWAVNYTSNSIAKINGKTISPTGDNDDPNIVQAYTTGTRPYSYSDMVGFGLFTTVLKNSGTWRVKFDSGYDSPHWTSIRWHAKMNEITQVMVRVRVAASEAELETGVWSEFYDVSPTNLSVLDLRWIQVEIYFYTLDQRYSPILDDFNLSFELPTG